MAKSTAKKSTGRVTASKPTTRSSASDFKKSKAKDLPLPSGKVCLVKNPGIFKFIEEGLIPNALLPIVTEALNRGKAPSQQDMTVTQDSLRDMLRMADNVTVYCVVDPPVRSDRFTEDDVLPDGYKVDDRIPDKLRDEELLYVDEVDDMDKMFIMNWAVGGTSDLAKFREEFAAGVEAAPTQ